MMESHRAIIDLIGSEPVRVWAYRCRLAASEVNSNLTNGNTDLAFRYRAKLHDARSAFVRNCRPEVGIAADDSVTRPEHWLNDFGNDTESHEAWRDADPSEAAVKAARVAWSELHSHRQLARHAPRPSPSELMP